jgi:hypothetical protein
LLFPGGGETEQADLLNSIIVVVDILLPGDDEMNEFLTWWVFK